MRSSIVRFICEVGVIRVSVTRRSDVWMSVRDDADQHCHRCVDSEAHFYSVESWRLWKHRKLHDPCQRQVIPVSLEEIKQKLKQVVVVVRSKVIKGEKERAFKLLILG